MKLRKLGIALLAFLFGCPVEGEMPLDSTLTIINKSNEPITNYWNYYNALDTLLPNMPFYPSIDQIKEHTIMPGDSLSYSGHFVASLQDQQAVVLMVFLFSYDSIRTLQWERIREKYLILERYDLSLQDLINRNWIVEYPK
jgi:hypothetical protein